MDKRASLRREFDDKRANQESAVKSDKMHSEQLAQLSSVEKTIANSFEVLLNYIDKNISKVELTNQLDSIKTPDIENVVNELKKLAETIVDAKTDQKPVIDALNGLKREITLLPSKIPQPKDQKDSIKVSNLSEVKLDTASLEKAIKGLNLKVDAPIVNIDKPDSYKSELKDILKAIRDIVIPEIKIPEQLPTDTSKIEKKLDESNKQLKLIAEKKFGGGGGGGNGTPYTDTSGTAKNVILTSDGKIPVDIDMTSEDISTATNQTNGSQKAQIVDASGNSITSDDNKLDVMAELIPLFRQMLLYMANPPYVDKTQNAIRNQVQSGTVTTVTTVTTLSNFGTMPADATYRLNSNIAWATNVRQIIT